MESFKNTKKQGDWGLGAAIALFTRKEITVSIPLTDSQDYDLIIDYDGLKTVQVKTTTYKRNNNYSVSLTVKGGNRSSKNQSIKKLDKKIVDYLFVITGDGEQYLIPTKDLKGSSGLSLYREYSKYKVG